MKRDFDLDREMSGPAAGIMVTAVLWSALTVLAFILKVNTYPVFATIGICGLIGGVITGEKVSGRRGALGTLLSVAVAVGISMIFSDSSYDGKVYHQPTLLAMLEGWNPIYEVYPYGNVWEIGALIQHYARGLEIVGLPAAALLGNLEAGKCLNPMLLIASLLTAYSVFPTLSRRRRLIVAVALAANPVVIAQSLTFYNDSTLYADALMIALSAMAWKETRGAGFIREKYRSGLRVRAVSTGAGINGRPSADADGFMAIAACATIIGVSTKPTHALYILLEWLVVAAWLRDKKIILTGLAAGLFSGFILCYSPYVTNWIGWGNPAYPLIGAEGFEIMENNTPVFMRGQDRFTAFLMSQFSTEEVPWGMLKGERSYMLGAPSVDSRVMGFGPIFVVLLFSGIFLIATSRRQASGWIVTSLCIAATFLFAQGWWVRYAPFLWCVPGVGLICQYRYGSTMHRTDLWLRGLMIVGVFFTVFLSGMRAVRSSLQFTIFERVISEEYRSGGLLAVSYGDYPIVGTHLALPARLRREPPRSDAELKYALSGGMIDDPDRALIIYLTPQAYERQTSGGFVDNVLLGKKNFIIDSKFFEGNIGKQE